MKPKAALLITVVVALFVAFSISALPVQSAVPGYEGVRKSLQTVDGERTYSVYTPKVKVAGKRPAVILLHGGFGTGSKMREHTMNGFEKLADREGFLVVYPEGYGRSWNDGRNDPHIRAQKAGTDDVAFLSKLIDTLVAKNGADPKRIYLGGISNGAMMSLRAACELSDKIAAIAPVAGSLPFEGQCARSSPVAMILIHGTKDPLVPYQGGQIKVLNQQRGTVIGAVGTMHVWAVHNAELLGKKSHEMESTSTILADSRPDDNLSVHKVIYPNLDVVLYTIINGGHTWPGGLQYAPAEAIGPTIRNFDATKTIWTFFKAHPKKSALPAELQSHYSFPYLNK